MRKHLAISLFVVSTVSTINCGKKKDGDGAGSATSTDKGGAAPSRPALTPDPPPAAITPSEKPPFESVVWQMTDKRDKGGFPKYYAHNLGTKPITFMAIHIYGYDASGKQVARNQTPMSWNGNLKPGKRSDFEIQVDSFGHENVPATATTFQVCYSSIKFEGDDAATSDYKRCPEQRPKS